MATYKVIQDIEAEDKLVGPLTLRQFIYAGICALCLYISFLFVTKNVAFLLAFTLPIAFTSGFFAFPWGKDQPTEIWALAKIRFMLKPRRRIWNQSGTKELVTITVPKKIERQLTNGLNQDEVQSRLTALANTIDSRGWAVKNVNINMTDAAVAPAVQSSDRLVAMSSLPQQVSDVDVRASDDILDEAANPVAHNFDSMIQASAAAHRQQLIEQMRQPSPPTPAPAPTPTVVSQEPSADYWFMKQQPAAAPGQATFTGSAVVTPGLPAQAEPALMPQAAVPTAEEQALIARFKAENSAQSVAYGHLKTLKTPEQLAAEARAAVALATAPKPKVTPESQAVIMNLANNDDLSVATIARQAHEQAELENGGEVVISLR